MLSILRSTLSKTAARSLAQADISAQPNVLQPPNQMQHQQRANIAQPSPQTFNPQKVTVRNFTTQAGPEQNNLANNRTDNLVTTANLTTQDNVFSGRAVYIPKNQNVNVPVDSLMYCRAVVLKVIDANGDTLGNAVMHYDGSDTRAFADMVKQEVSDNTNGQPVTFELVAVHSGRETMSALPSNNKRMNETTPHILELMQPGLSQNYAEIEKEGKVQSKEKCNELAKQCKRDGFIDSSIDRVSDLGQRRDALITIVDGEVTGSYAIEEHRLKAVQEYAQDNDNVNPTVPERASAKVTTKDTAANISNAMKQVSQSGELGSLQNAKVSDQKGTNYRNNAPDVTPKDREHGV